MLCKICGKITKNKELICDQCMYEKEEEKLDIDDYLSIH